MTTGSAASVSRSHSPGSLPRQKRPGRLLTRSAGYLAGHFGTSIQRAAPLAQALVGQVVSGQPIDDVVQDFRQAVIQGTAADQDPAIHGNVIQAPQAAAQARAEAERQSLDALRAAYASCGLA